MRTVRIILDMAFPPFSISRSLRCAQSHIWARLKGAAHIVWPVLFSMFHLRKHNEIFKSVIISSAVNVMDMFMRLKNASVRLLPDESMFEDITSGSARMARHEQHDITIYGVMASTFPLRMFFAQSFWIVAWKVRNGMTHEPSFGSQVESCHRRLLATPALTDATGNFFGTGNEFWPMRDDSSQHMTPNKPWGSIGMPRMRFNRAATAAFT